MLKKHILQILSETQISVSLIWSVLLFCLTSLVQLRREFPLRPKSQGFDSGAWIEIANASSWIGALGPFNWRFREFSTDRFGIFEYSPGPAVLRDVVYRQVSAFQIWHNSASRGSAALSVDGVFGALTQKATDEMPIGPDLWPLNFCESAPVSDNVTSSRLLLRPLLRESLQSNGVLTLVVIVPVAVVATLLCGVLAFAYLSGGPRLPVAGTKPGHVDPQWRAPLYEAFDVPQADVDRMDSWDDYDLQDPDVWTYYPSEYDTSELEDEMVRMREDPTYKKSVKRGVQTGTQGRGNVVTATAVPAKQQGGDSEEGEAVVDVNSVYPSRGAPALPVQGREQARGAEDDDDEDEDELETETDSSAAPAASAPARPPVASSSVPRVAVALAPANAGSSEQYYESEDEEEWSYYSSSHQSGPPAAVTAPLQLGKSVVVKQPSNATSNGSGEDEDEFETDEYEISTFTTEEK